jgi:hypothetical protein
MKICLSLRNSVKNHLAPAEFQAGIAQFAPSVHSWSNNPFISEDYN